MQVIAANTELREDFAAALQNMLTFTLPSAAHFDGLMHVVEHQGLRMQTNPFTPRSTNINSEAAKMQQHAHGNEREIHQHTDSCTLGTSGICHCRTAQPQPLTDTLLATMTVQEICLDARTPSSHSAVRIHQQVDANGHATVTPLPITPIRATKTLLATNTPFLYYGHDPRYIDVICNRPRLSLQEFLYDDTIRAAKFSAMTEQVQHWFQTAFESRNGVVTTHSPILGLATRASSCDVYIGGPAAAKSAMFYITEYIAGNETVLKFLAPLALAARHKALEPSQRSPETDPTLEHRKDQQFLTMLLNAFTAKMELSATQTAVCLLGIPETLCSDHFAWIFARQMSVWCLTYACRLDPTLLEHWRHNQHPHGRHAKSAGVPDATAGSSTLSADNIDQDILRPATSDPDAGSDDVDADADDINEALPQLFGRHTSAYSHRRGTGRLYKVHSVSTNIASDLVVVDVFQNDQYRLRPRAIAPFTRRYDFFAVYELGLKDKEPHYNDPSHTSHAGRPASVTYEFEQDILEGATQVLKLHFFLRRRTVLCVPKISGNKLPCLPAHWETASRERDELALMYVVTFSIGLWKTDTPEERAIAYTSPYQYTFEGFLQMMVDLQQSETFIDRSLSAIIVTALGQFVTNSFHRLINHKLRHQATDEWKVLQNQCTAATFDRHIRALHYSTQPADVAPVPSEPVYVALSSQDIEDDVVNLARQLELLKPASQRQQTVELHYQAHWTPITAQFNILLDTARSATTDSHISRARLLPLPQHSSASTEDCAASFASMKEYADKVGHNLLANHVFHHPDLIPEKWKTPQFLEQHSHLGFIPASTILAGILERMAVVPDADGIIRHVTAHQHDFLTYVVDQIDRLQRREITTVHCLCLGLLLKIVFPVSLLCIFTTLSQFRIFTFSFVCLSLFRYPWQWQNIHGRNNSRHIHNSGLDRRFSGPSRRRRFGYLWRENASSQFSLAPQCQTIETGRP